MNKYDELYNIAEQVMVYSKTRGHYYALQIWNTMFENWCVLENQGSVVLPHDVIDNLKQRHLLFCDYFEDET